MRLLMGLLAGSASTVRFVGDESLSGRPMDRVAEPLRLMGASVETTDAHAPVLVKGAKLKGIRYSTSTPSAQVKSSVLFAALSAEGETVLEEPAPTRDHTERALAALGAPVVSSPGRVGLRSFQHEGFEATVPGDPSSAAFLIAGAALTGSSMIITDLGLNPSRMHYLSVMERMGVRTTLHVERSELGEPVGTLHVEPATSLTGTSISGEELPLVIDEVPVLALMATHAEGETWFLGASELKVKESDRLRAIASGIWSLGGHAGDEGEDLVVSGLGLTGGRADAGGDHRMAMAFAVAALAADAPCEISGMEAAAVSFPGFIQTLEALGARIEVLEK